MKPDWNNAPDWAQWLAQDADGTWHWFEAEPIALTTADSWASSGGLSAICDMLTALRPEWYRTLESRPTWRPLWPSAPAWATWLACHPDGSWCWYEYEPQYNDWRHEWQGYGGRQLAAGPVGQSVGRGVGVLLERRP